MNDLYIGHFLAHYPSPGGTTNTVEGLSRGLSRLGHSVTIFTYANSTVELGEARFHVKAFPFSSWWAFAAPKELIKHLESNLSQLDMIIIHGMFNPFSIPIAKAARRGGIPYIIHPHDPYHPVLLGKSKVRKLIYSMLYERRLLNSALAVQVYVESHADHLRNYGITVPVFAVPNGFDPEVISKNVEKSVEVVNREKCGEKVLFLGRLDAHNKGLDVLLRAFARALSQGLSTKASLHLVGPDWGDQNTLEKLAGRLEIRDKVVFAGPEYARSPYDIIMDYDLLVLPSRYEGFGLSCLEAMVCEKPVIVSKEAGISHFVREGDAGVGWLVEPNVESICNALLQAFDSKDLWTRIGKRGRNIAYENLTWDRIARQAAAHYQKLLKKHK